MSSPTNDNLEQSRGRSYITIDNIKRIKKQRSVGKTDIVLLIVVYIKLRVKNTVVDLF